MPGPRRSGTERRGDVPQRSDAYQRIYATVDSIPRGRVATYGQIAAEAHLPRRARMVGRALRQLPKGSKLPWHRVVGASGHVSPRGDPAGEALQRRRLAREGVELSKSGRVDLERFRWRT